MSKSVHLTKLKKGNKIQKQGKVISQGNQNAMILRQNCGHLPKGNKIYILFYKSEQVDMRHNTHNNYLEGY